MKYSDFLDHCLETWQLGCEYHIVPGIIEEAGEVSGKYKRLKRGDYDKKHERALSLGEPSLGIYESFIQDVVLELGDVLYYCVVGLREYGYVDDFNLEDKTAFVSDTSSQELAICLPLNNIVSSAVQTMRTDEYTHLFDAIKNINALCNYLNISIHDVIDSNIKKLQSRKNRGKIFGEGDKR